MTYLPLPILLLQAVSLFCIVLHQQLIKREEARAATVGQVLAATVLLMDPDQGNWPRKQRCFRPYN